MRVPFAPFKKSAASAAGEDPVCANCSAPLAVGQDWCLECGTAMPGRFGRGPGLRSSLGVVGVTLLLVTGAVAAAYAGLSSDSKRATQATASVPGQALPRPDVAATAPPSVAGPAPGIVLPGTAKPAAPPKAPPATPTPTAAATPTAPSTTAPTASTAPAKTVAKPKKTTSATPTAKAANILLDTDAASTYNPDHLPSDSFGDPAKAIDGASLTSWTYRLDQRTAGKTLVGLAINLKSAQKVSAISITTATPGMTVEFYGSTGAQPAAITDPAWLHLASRSAIKARATVALNTQGKSLDYLLVWITHAPSGMTSGTIGISELTLTG